eukprot:gene24293-1552_t
MSSSSEDEGGAAMSMGMEMHLDQEIEDDLENETQMPIDLDVEEMEEMRSPRSLCSTDILTGYSETVSAGPSSITDGTESTAFDRDNLDARPLKKRKRRRRKKVVIINTNYCKYDVVRDVAYAMGWVEDKDVEGEMNLLTLLWTNSHIPLSRLMLLHDYQRHNHFPSMHLITRKINL